jgi:hypothetical protein
MSANTKNIFALLAFACLLNFTVACSKDTQQAQEEEEEEQQRQEKEAAEAKSAVETWHPKLICPQVAIVHELDTIRDYGGAQQPAANQLVAASRMQSVSGDCGYQDDGIDIAFELDFTAARGAHLSGRNVEFPFFVAVIDPDGHILNKNQMTEKFHFKDEDKTAERSDNLHVFIPMPKDQHKAGPNYRVLTGFQLTEDQLKQVRAAETKAEIAHQPVSAGQPAAGSNGSGISWR